jgi:uncharacterized oligopeptide transporter (OPT) family protein
MARGSAPSSRHPSVFEPATLVLGLGVAALGSIIGLELITRVGITPNSSIIAAIAAMGVARLPLPLFASFRSVHRQNLMQTIISGATFGAANGILLPAGVLWLMGRVELIPAMILGAACGLAISAALIYRLFDSRLFPASGLWPSGVATAECIIAGDRGGKRARLLLAGALAGAGGHLGGIPMDIFGVCWIGNVWALFMFGAGLLVRGHAAHFGGAEITGMYVPQGFMVGAGLVALGQIVRAIRRNGGGGASGPSTASPPGATVGYGFVAFVAAASILAALAGLGADLSTGALVGFVVFAAGSALVSELIVGIAAMHSGWFPAFATALIFLMLGMALGFPPIPLAFLVGFTASASPAFADMGYDLKAGWILRGQGVDPDLEREGRRQQLIAELLGLGVAAITVWLAYSRYFSAGLFPPWDHVAAATISAGSTPAVARRLALWALPGALLQLVGGPARQLGVLFATGLLIENPVAGWTAMASLAVRGLLAWRYREKADGPMYVLAGGFIAGSAVTSFGSATLRIR